VGRIIASNADEWRDIASASFVPLSIQQSANDFTASLDMRQLSPDVSIAGVTDQAIVISRTERLASAAISDDVHISLQASGRGTVSQSGRVAQVAPGVLTVTETHRPFTLNYVEPNQRHIVLQASRSALGVSDDMIRHVTGRQLAGINPARDAYVSLVTSLMAQPETLSETASLEMSSIVTSLASAMLRSAFESSPIMPTTNEALLVAMTDFIRAHLASPMLSPETVARAHFVSRRKMYEIFEASGETPADVIRRERIQRAASMLEDRAQAWSISDVAFASGFGDVTTFTRAFRRYFGVTPREWRGGLDTPASRALDHR
jgi:AraC-like DNA-binding protein